MNKIIDHKDESVYTFETGIIGKENLFISEKSNKIIIPGYQIGFQIRQDNIYFDKVYLIFNNVSSFKNKLSFYNSNSISSSKEYLLDLFGSASLKKIELESIAFRDDIEIYSILEIEYDSFDILYNNETNYKVLENVNATIQQQNLKSFLEFKEFENDMRFMD